VPTSSISASANIAARLCETARRMPRATGVVVARGRDRGGAQRYRSWTFRELDDDSSAIARGLIAMGVTAGTRLALLVRPGFDFLSLVFALFKAGAVIVLIDPGMGKRRVLKCLEDAAPQGFIAVPLVHAVRVLARRRFPQARLNVTVGHRWCWGGPTLRQVRRRGRSEEKINVPVDVSADDPAAIIFTTGSTGPPKGVQYTHGNFGRQVDEIREFYGIRPGEIDVACFPLFALFNAAMGVTTVVPRMDFSRPATADPRNVIDCLRDQQATQAFASPAVWNVVGRYCEEHNVQLPSLRRVLSCGAPVPAHVLKRMKSCIHAVGDVHTPYGATEALPVASIAASELLRETQPLTERGGGVCVGRRFTGIEWKVVRIAEGPIASIADVEELPTGQIGELIVRGDVVTRQYVNRREANAAAKIKDGDAIWHRLGDAGYLDDADRFWFCGRVAHRLTMPDGPMYTIPCEAIFNLHPRVFRSALVGLGPQGKQRPVIVVQPEEGAFPRGRTQQAAFVSELRELARGNPLTAGIDEFLFHPAFPVDIRHNAKIFRERLAVWAAGRLKPKA
jgi:acyl-CoA synthetase (AMP-forming)/AMP-acid ligase II